MNIKYASLIVLASTFIYSAAWSEPFVRKVRLQCRNDISANSGNYLLGTVEIYQVIGRDTKGDSVFWLNTKRCEENEDITFTIRGDTEFSPEGYPIDFVALKLRLSTRFEGQSDTYNSCTMKQSKFTPKISAECRVNGGSYDKIRAVIHPE
ncbi:MAG: hypothetical protein ACKE51_05770 [Methylococcaceae bacterium]